MAWTAPKTWTSETLTSTDLNTYVRDNQNHIKNRLDAQDSYSGNTSNYTTTSTSFVDIDATNLKLTITTNGGTVLIGFSGDFQQNSVDDDIVLDIDIDSSSGTSGHIITRNFDVINTRTYPMTFVFKKEGLSAGSHIFKVQWKVTGGTGTLLGTYPHFWVQEI